MVATSSSSIYNADSVKLFGVLMMMSHLSQQKSKYCLVKKLGNRQLALRPNFNQSPKVWTNSLIDESLEHTDTFHYKDLLGHYGCVNTVEFSRDGNFMISGGDDKRVFIWRLWDAIADANYRPKVMGKEHNSNIFCLSFDQEQQRIYSGGNDELVIVHNIETGDAIDVFAHMDDVYGISVNPTNNNIFATASNEISIWDLRSSLSCQHLPMGNGVFHGVMYNPVQTFMIVTASTRNGIELYDVRQPLQKLSRFYPSYILNNLSAMCVRFNRTGNKILALGRKLPPVLYDVRSPYPQLQFEGDGFFNLCTLKNCSFAGRNDQFVISGSDNFFIYMWKIPDTIMNDSCLNNPLKQDAVDFVTKPTQVLTGHRSIVNQVRFNDQNGIIASTGVEKIIRLWSPMIQFEENKSINSKESNFSREFYSYGDFIDILGSHNENSVEEDIRLIAYFDSMLDRDVSFSSYSSSDDDASSYFAFDGSFSASAIEDAENCSSTECISDLDEKFSIQNRFEFNIKSGNLRCLSTDHLDLVYAKRMHVRYLTSIIDNIIKQIEKILPELHRILQDASTQNSTETKDNERVSTLSKNILLLLREQKNELREYDNLYDNIQNKKRYKLLLRANRLVTELYIALYSKSLFQRAYRNRGELELPIIIKYLEKTDQVDLLARKMCLIEDRKLYDRRLRNLISNLYKKVLHLAKMLLDVKVQLFIKIPSNSECHLSFHSIISNNNESSSHEHSISCFYKQTMARHLIQNLADIDIESTSSSDLDGWNTDLSIDDELIDDADPEIGGDNNLKDDEMDEEQSDGEKFVNSTSRQNRRKHDVISSIFGISSDESSEDSFTDTDEDEESNNDDDDNQDHKDSEAQKNNHNIHNSNRAENIENGCENEQNSDGNIKNNNEKIRNNDPCSLSSSCSSSIQNNNTNNIHFKKIENYRKRNYKSNNGRRKSSRKFSHSSSMNPSKKFRHY